MAWWDTTFGASAIAKTHIATHFTNWIWLHSRLCLLQPFVRCLTRAWNGNETKQYIFTMEKEFNKDKAMTDKLKSPCNKRWYWSIQLGHICDNTGMRNTCQCNSFPWGSWKRGFNNGCPEDLVSDQKVVKGYDNQCDQEKQGSVLNPGIFQNLDDSWSILNVNGGYFHMEIDLEWVSTGSSGNPDGFDRRKFGTDYIRWYWSRQIRIKNMKRLLDLA